MEITKKTKDKKCRWKEPWQTGAANVESRMEAPQIFKLPCNPAGPSWAYTWRNPSQHNVYCCSLLNSQDMEPTDEWMKKMWKGNVQRGLNNVMPLKGEKWMKPDIILSEISQMQMLHFLLEEESIKNECLCMYVTWRQKDLQGRNRTRKRVGWWSYGGGQCE